MEGRRANSNLYGLLPVRTLRYPANSTSTIPCRTILGKPANGLDVNASKELSLPGVDGDVRGEGISEVYNRKRIQPP